jgi:hypothetical protein
MVYQVYQVIPSIPSIPVTHPSSIYTESNDEIS